MGEIQNRPFRLSFNASLKVGFQGSRVTSDGGLILVRELDERLGFGELIAQHLTDSRGKNAQLGFADPLRQSVYSRLAGYEPVGREFESLRAHHSFLTLQLPQGTTKNNGKDRRSLCGFIPLRTLLNNQLLEHFRFTCCRLKVAQGCFFSRKKPRGFPAPCKKQDRKCRSRRV